MVKRFLPRFDYGARLLIRQNSFVQFITSILNQANGVETPIAGLTESKDFSQPSLSNKENKLRNDHEGVGKEIELNNNHGVRKDKPDDDGNELNGWKWKLDTPWLSKALEPATQIFKWTSNAENGDARVLPPSSRSIVEIFSDLQRSKLGIQDWSFGDLTVGLYLVYLSQATEKHKDTSGVPIFSESVVEDLIYHVELAKGAYKGNAAGLARHSMLQEKNILKFVKDSSVMRPGYYMGIDVRNKLVVFGIRGTDTVSDIITDIVSSGGKKDILFEGYSAHFGAAEAARYFLYHELKNIRKCMETHKGFRLRIVGHSLGGSSAALFAIMLRKKSKQELGFNPNSISAVGFGTPPCLSKNLAESCSEYVSTIVMQDDIVPRLSVDSLTRLRSEIVRTDWTDVFEKEDYKRVIDWIENAKQAFFKVQDVGQKLSQFANFRNLPTTPANISTTNVGEPAGPWASSVLTSSRRAETEELYVPGTLYYLKKHMDTYDGKKKGGVTYSLWKMQSHELAQRILLSGNLISDHKCDSHYYALREVLKGLPPASEDIDS